MSSPSWLIDTNVFIGLEDEREVHPEFATLVQLASKHGVKLLIHAAARDDIARDQDARRRKISLSKVRKFEALAKVRGLTPAKLTALFGPLARPNDIVDATLLHALTLNVADFLVTQDRGLHERARRHSPGLAERVVFVADAVALLYSTYEPRHVPIRYVEEVDAHELEADHAIFDSLREGYPEFDDWWRDKCVQPRRKCWIVTHDEDLAGLVVRKDEVASDTDASLPGQKILKICTFKVRPEYRGTKLGELLFKQVFWFAQANSYDVVYVTTFQDQDALITLLEFYGFQHTRDNARGEMVFEKAFSRDALHCSSNQSRYDAARLNYPRFVTGAGTDAYCVPIQENFHEALFPELTEWDADSAGTPKTPGNTIRKVYLCRAQARISQPGSVLVFYKSKSDRGQSQALTTLGIFEDVSLAYSTDELIRMAGNRSVYTRQQLVDFRATAARPVKVINFLLVAHVRPAVTLDELISDGILRGPPQSICKLTNKGLRAVLARANLGFEA
ncbi:MAG TPA: GNAT family N-acetyltransferase [Allosphingosinicella sp.]|jgi:GNAT superfamily N-acetyltransferase